MVIPGSMEQSRKQTLRHGGVNRDNGTAQPHYSPTAFRKISSEKSNH
jgi:hypothetical protein